MLQAQYNIILNKVESQLWIINECKSKWFWQVWKISEVESKILKRYLKWILQHTKDDLEVFDFLIEKLSISHSYLLSKKWEYTDKMVSIKHWKLILESDITLSELDHSIWNTEIQQKLWLYLKRLASYNWIWKNTNTLLKALWIKWIEKCILKYNKLKIVSYKTNISFFPLHKCIISGLTNKYENFIVVAEVEWSIFWNKNWKYHFCVTNQKWNIKWFILYLSGELKLEHWTEANIVDEVDLRIWNMPITFEWSRPIYLKSHISKYIPIWNNSYIENHLEWILTASAIKETSDLVLSAVDWTYESVDTPQHKIWWNPFVIQWLEEYKWKELLLQVDSQDNQLIIWDMWVIKFFGELERNTDADFKIYDDIKIQIDCY